MVMGMILLVDLFGFRDDAMVFHKCSFNILQTTKSRKSSLLSSDGLLRATPPSLSPPSRHTLVGCTSTCGEQILEIIQYLNLGFKILKYSNICWWYCYFSNPLWKSNQLGQTRQLAFSCQEVLEPPYKLYKFHTKRNTVQSILVFRCMYIIQFYFNEQKSNLA